jgi:hypothetical protein
MARSESHTGLVNYACPPAPSAHNPARGFVYAPGPSVAIWQGGCQMR